MINLLPATHKKQIRAGRSNVLLLRYTILSVIAIVFLGLIAGGTYLVMTNIKMNAENTIADNRERSSSYAEVEQQANEFRANLQVAKSILDREVDYTNVVLAIAQSLPRNAVLDNLALDSANFGTPFSLSAKTRSYNDALILKDTLQASDVFDNVYLESISEASGDDSGDYPISVSLNVTINKEVTQDE